MPADATESPPEIPDEKDFSGALLKDHGLDLVRFPERTSPAELESVKVAQRPRTAEIASGLVALHEGRQAPLLPAS